MRHLTEDARIVDNIPFDCGVVKIINKDVISMTQEEKNACHQLRKNQGAPRQDVLAAGLPASPPSFVKIAIGAKRTRLDELEEYENCEWIPPTSNMVERLFSRDWVPVGSTWIQIIWRCC